MTKLTRIKPKPAPVPEHRLASAPELEQPPELERPVYIPSVEACDLYGHQFREEALSLLYVGMIPSSLELNQLIRSGLTYTVQKKNGKRCSADIISVKFTKKVSSGKEIGKAVRKKISATSDEAYRHKLELFMDKLAQEAELDKWRGLAAHELRTHLYTHGFSYKGTRYVVYKRSSAKSRIGHCLFIKESLCEPMLSWSRMGLDFTGAAKVDYPSLLAYEALVGSSLEGLMRLDPGQILLVNDVNSTFTVPASAIKLGAHGYLDSCAEEVQISNSLFDGQSLLDTTCFASDSSMLLLRNHMFKSAAFRCDIQQFLKDHCPPEVAYNDWKLSTMFEGVEVFARDVRLITTPNSLKALKFSQLCGSEQQMWAYWQQYVRDQGAIFGICKSEHSSKMGHDGHRIVQQLSYQMLNSLPLNAEAVQELCAFELRYIESLKNDDALFIAHLEHTATHMNNHAMFIALFQRNREIVRTELFRRFRKDVIHAYVTKLKTGKIRLPGDYCVMLGNPLEYLYHAIGRLDTRNPQSVALHNNEVDCRLFPEKELTGFRNPHTGPANVLVVQNRHCQRIRDYFHLSSNIVCVNAIGFELMDRLSGSDYDSDTVLLVDHPQLLEVSRQIFGRYPVCVNQVTAHKKQYRVTAEDMATIDNELSKSHLYIGRTVNLGQLCMSTYWDQINKGVPPSDLRALYKKIEIVSVLSGICIDLAKKMYAIDINQEIKAISQLQELTPSKPLFWMFVSQNQGIETAFHHCPMDYLFKQLSSLKMAPYKRNLPLSDLLAERNSAQEDRKQKQKIIQYVNEMVGKLTSLYKEDLRKEEQERLMQENLTLYGYYISKLKINPHTMHALIREAVKPRAEEKMATRLLGTLFAHHQNVFMSCFVAQNSTF